MSEQIDLTDYADSDSEEDFEWVEKRLGEIFESIYSGGTPKKGVDEYYHGDIPFVKIEDLNEQQGGGVTTAENYITEQALEETSTRAFDSGTLLMTIYGSLAETALVQSRVATNQGILGLWDADDDNVLYVRYAIDNSQPKLASLSRQTTQANLGKGIVKKHKIPIPPLPEQRKISTVLYTVDRTIDKTEQLVEQTKRVQRGVEKRLFREGYFDHPNIEEKRLVTIPKDWDFDQLSKHTIHSAFGPRFGSERYDDEGNISTLRTTDLDDRGHISLETMPVADLEFDEIEDHLLEPDDFIITRSGTTGIGTVWKGYDNPTIPGAFLIRFRFEKSLNPDFMKYYVNSSIGRSRVNSRAKGGVQKNLAGSDLLNMRFPIPDKEEQQRIVEVLDGFEELIQHERKYKSKLKRFKRGLMQDLLSGTVRTTDTNIEVPEEIAQYG